jgi:hypothetical protein
MAPGGTHYYDPYQVTVYGSGTIYYTTDGTTPTLSSNSGINNLQITIDQNKEIKAFLVDGQGSTSAIFTTKYYTGAIPTANIYFKVPSTWTNGGCAMVDMVNPNSINGFVIDTIWPGFPMTNTGCEGWYKLVRNFENANISFNNCTPFYNIPTSISTNIIPMGSTIYYDFTNGEISNPPSCLFLNTDETKSKSIALVKVYPNPVSDVLKINSTKDFKDYEIIDPSGKIISKNPISSNEIPTSHLTSGNYFIKLKDLQGNLIFLKFIKK